MYKSFNDWLWETWEIRERNLTVKNVMKAYGVNEVEAQGTIDNFWDEYGDYLVSIGQYENYKKDMGKK